jgi:phosphoribulokinase
MDNNTDSEGAEKPIGQAMHYVPTFREKIGWKLFPRTWTEHPELTNSKDGLVCRTVAKTN